MYVVKLDRPWVSTPFDPQGFPISSSAQVRVLAKYCKSVHVDAGRTVKRARPVARVRKKIPLVRKKAPAGSRSRSKSAARPR